MAKYRGVARDEFGNALSGATVTVYEFGTTTESTIYSDTELVTSQENPITVGDDGVFVFYSYPGQYDIQVAKSGFTTITLENELVGSSIAACTGANLGAIAPGATPDAIGNTNLGATHLVSQYETNAWSIDVDTGVYTYSGEETIICQVAVSFSFQLTVSDSTIGIQAYKNFATAPELIGSFAVEGVQTDPRSGALVGIVEIATDDTVTFTCTAPTGGASISPVIANYAVTRIG